MTEQSNTDVGRATRDLGNDVPSPVLDDEVSVREKTEIKPPTPIPTIANAEVLDSDLLLDESSLS
jgi:hypothetical protein